MYFLYFVVYIAVGLAISVAAFAWAMANGQFQDQQRARFLPLRGDADEPLPKATPFGRWEIIGLFVLAVAGLGASAAVLAYALYFSK